MPRTRPVLRWLATGATLLILALFVLSLPFYSGSSISPHFTWRLEHSRLKLERRPVAFHESFYVDFNSEGLRWAPDGHFYDAQEWFVIIPLWAPLALTAPAAAFLWHRRFTHRAPGLCKRCGYDRRALPAGSPCPECGSGKPPRPN